MTTAKTAKRGAKANLKKIERDFLRGRDIAIEMLGWVREANDGDESSAWRHMRGGKPQENFVKHYIDDLRRDGSLIDGFSATLSAMLSDDAATSASNLATYKLPMAEFLAGEVGADGTKVFEDLDTPVQILQQPGSGPAPWSASAALSDAEMHAANAVAVLSAAALDVQGNEKGNAPAVYGLRSIARMVQDSIVTAEKEQTIEALEETSIQCEQAIAVCNAFIELGAGGELIFAADTLMTLTKRTVDDAVSALAAEAKGR